MTIVVHYFRHVSDLAFRTERESHLSGGPLFQDQALLQMIYVPIVTHEPFHTSGRIGDTRHLGSCRVHGLTDLKRGLHLEGTGYV